MAGLIALPKIVYTPSGGSPTTLQFKRGPQNFQCVYDARANDNLSTSGLRERVFEFADMLITFSMQNMLIADSTDYPAWAAFMKSALPGITFAFYPNTSSGFVSDYCNCVLDDKAWKPVRQGPGRYAADFNFRVVPDIYMPSDPSVVMEWFYGI